MMAAPGDGTAQNFIALPKDELVARVQKFTGGDSNHRLAVPALAAKLVEYHEEHPRTAMLYRAPRIPDADRQQLLRILGDIGWHRYHVGQKKYTKISKRKGVIRTTFKAIMGKSVRAAAGGSQNFVLGVSRGPLGSDGFEKRGADGIGKNTTIVKSRQKKDYRACMDLWRTMKRIVKAVDPGYTFTSIQVNRNFLGKPHRDKGDRSYQYALSLGSFTGGELLIETDNPQKLAMLETKDRLSKCDGRRCHWVAPYSGTRYSLIMYRNLGRKTPLLSNRGKDINVTPATLIHSKSH